ncbi:PREDICTED: protein Wnt-1-like isoform X2 [Acropora digitifera]|uniref:protein Wnt-1-like isoform X2 n=1 Tax=Acropora digitifera TaxID=70779 RepID=UPI00077AF649|nr:PREDICTED: protein Wnt-1-like isoform X2 [Acropora digitifera]XP_015762753.1 PREDICTED: protein Wnt-1-like isoform X2 [Acropora digitifera]
MTSLAAILVLASFALINNLGIMAQIKNDQIVAQEAYQLLSNIIREGGHLGLEECRKQFKNEIWNCSLNHKHIHKQLPIFVKTTLPYANRETAFVHAISTAAITHKITTQCKQGKIPGCNCAVIKKSHKPGDDWQWGGCSDNIRFGEKVTKRFIDSLEKGNDARVAFNLHNNEVGRKVVRSSTKRECKCHGVTGSCSLKTCWKELGPLETVGSRLKQIYRSAARVLFENNKLKERINRQLRVVSSKEKKLVYLDASPNYCLRNDTFGLPGMRGRTCRGDEAPLSKCRSLCERCGLQHHTVEKYKQIKCKCKFVWCCSVKCETCTSKYSLTTCTR